MKIITIGKGGKIHNLNVNRNILVTDDLSKIDSLVEIHENGEIFNLDANDNEVHTPESYAIKITPIRKKAINELELEISELKNEVTKAQLQADINKMKNLPYTLKGQHSFRQSLIDFKDFSISLGAILVAEIAIKQLGI